MFNLDSKIGRLKAEAFLKGFVAEAPQDVEVGGNVHRFLLEVLSRHHDAENKVGAGVVSFHLIDSAEGDGRGVHFVRKDGTVGRFSYTKAFSHMRSPARAMRERLLERMRNLADVDVRTACDVYLRKFKTLPRCALTGVRLTPGGYDLDHRPPDTFAALAKRFLLTAEVGSPHFDEAWRDFHARHAKIDLVDRAAHVAEHAKAVPTVRKNPPHFVIKI